MEQRNSKMKKMATRESANDISVVGGESNLAASSLQKTAETNVQELAKQNQTIDDVRDVEASAGINPRIK